MGQPLGAPFRRWGNGDSENLGTHSVRVSGTSFYFGHWKDSSWEQQYEVSKKIFSFLGNWKNKLWDERMCFSSGSVSCSVFSDSVTPGLQPTRLLCPWILQGRTLEWVAIPFSRGSSRPRDWTWVSCIAGKFFTVWVTREAHHLSREYEYTHLCTNVARKYNFKFLFMEEGFPRQRDHKSREVIMQPWGTEEKRGIQSKFLLLRVWSEEQKHGYFWKPLDN